MGGNNEVESMDFYQVLGLKKGCSDAELKNAYKKLALRWHPDRCSAFGNSKHVDDAKKKFQTIQEAYSVLSNANKRFLYDVGVYDTDDDDENGMADFLNEMAVMMSENKPAAENGDDTTTTFEQLKDLFEEMFQSDIIDSLTSSSQTGSSASSNLFSSPSGESSTSTSTSNKRASSEMSNTNAPVGEPNFQGFCLGTGGLFPAGRGRSARKGSSTSRKGCR